MKADYKDFKGAIVMMCGETQNTFPYKDNEELFELLKRFSIHLEKEVIDVYDFVDRFVFYLFNEEDIEKLKEELK